MPTFTPAPPANYRMPLCPFKPYERPFSFYTQPHPAAILKKDGHFLRVYAPTWETLDVLEEGVEHFSEGRQYTVSQEVADQLTADGFGAYINA